MLFESISRNGSLGWKSAVLFGDSVECRTQIALCFCIYALHANEIPRTDPLVQGRLRARRRFGYWGRANRAICAIRVVTIPRSGVQVAPPLPLSPHLRMAGCSATVFGAGGSLCNSSDIRLRSASKVLERGPRTDGSPCPFAIASTSRSISRLNCPSCCSRRCRFAFDVAARRFRSSRYVRMYSEITFGARNSAFSPMSTARLRRRAHSGLREARASDGSVTARAVDHFRSAT